jgi:hypothetical protein
MNKNTITSILRSFFAQFKGLIGTPRFTGKKSVTVPYYLPKGELTETKINALGLALSHGFPICISMGNHRDYNRVTLPSYAGIELRLVRLQYPYLDSSILGQYIALNASKYNFLRMKKMLFKKLPIQKVQSEPLPT